MKRLTSADLFSGAGGLTEGFRQAGFKILASLDNWAPAAETHWKNFPRTEMFHADILEFEPSELPDVDVLIGSPPCTEFSYSNRGGHGDLNLGMKFVLRFLRFVHDVRPRYWAMENVPRLYQTLPSRVPLRRLGLQEDGFLEIPVRKVLNAADYGAPQRRLRLFSGNFPLPEPTHCDSETLDSFTGRQPWTTVQDVLNCLPDPLRRSDAPSAVTDPNYGFKLPVDRLSDHFMDTSLTREEIEINRKTKTDHSWYGRMAFPDPTDRPARTVMATQTGVSRETLVIEWERDGRRVYRRPTIRECASFQTFPITYQFWGRTAETRYKLVGNAVPPVLAAAVAKAIISDAGGVVPRSPIVTKQCWELPPAVEVARRRGGFNVRRFPVNRKFRDHIPGSRAHGFRVDVDNQGKRKAEPFPRHQMRKPPSHALWWESRLYVGSGKEFACVTPTFEQAVDQLATCCTGNDERHRAQELAADLERRLAPWLPDATTLQAAWAGKIARRGIGPREILVRLARTVDKCFPSDKYDSVNGPVSTVFPRIGRNEMPVRTAAFLFAARFAVDVIDLLGPGVTLGSSALEEFAIQSGTVLEEGTGSAEYPRAYQLVSDAIVTRAVSRPVDSRQALDVG